MFWTTINFLNALKDHYPNLKSYKKSLCTRFATRNTAVDKCV